MVAQNKSKKFDICEVLSAVTSLRLSSQGLGGFYAVLEHMTGSEIYTNQVDRAQGSQVKLICKQHPKLQNRFSQERLAKLSEQLQRRTSKPSRVRAVKAYLRAMSRAHGQHLALERSPSISYNPMDPFEEFALMYGRTDAIVIAR